MDSGAVITAMFSLMASACIGLFGWTLMQTNRLSTQHSALDNTTRALMVRIDLLVTKLEANFNIQISEQVARNVLQEKVVNLEHAVRKLERAGDGSEGRRGRRSPLEEEPA